MLGLLTKATWLVNLKVHHKYLKTNKFTCCYLLLFFIHIYTYIHTQKHKCVCVCVHVNLVYLGRNPLLKPVLLNITGLEWLLNLLVSFPYSTPAKGLTDTPSQFHSIRYNSANSFCLMTFKFSTYLSPSLQGKKYELFTHLPPHTHTKLY